MYGHDSSESDLSIAHTSISSSSKLLLKVVMRHIGSVVVPPCASVRSNGIRRRSCPGSGGIAPPIFTISSSSISTYSCQTTRPAGTCPGTATLRGGGSALSDLPAKLDVVT